MDKQKIIAEIKRLADANGGKPLGMSRFERETGIAVKDWFPDLWFRWGDALKEAGYSANTLQARIADETVLTKYIEFARELGRFPIKGELILKAKTDPEFPSNQTFNRFGGKDKLIEAVAAHCRDKPAYQDVVALCDARRQSPIKTQDSNSKAKLSIGFVYLVKSGRHYKIGRTNSIARRGGELAVTIPIPPKSIHVIATDDPSGVEAYWHRRFTDKRGQGEWFELSPDDVRAFKSWKRIV